MHLRSKLLLGPALLAAAALVAPAAGADAMSCSLSGYKAAPGLSATMEGGNTLAVSWDGEKGQQLRMRLTINGGTPTIQDLAVKKQGGQWVTLATNLAPEFRFASGYRRLDQEAYPALKEAYGTVTQQILDHYKWDAFWDAPLNVPGNEIAHGNSTPPPDGIPGTNQPGLPRKESEIHRGNASFNATGCEVKTNGQRIEVAFPGATMDIFNSGKLQYTVYKGTDLVRMELIAKTDQDSVAYKYDAGLKGIAVKPNSKLVWRDVSNTWQDYDLDGAKNNAPATVRAANRLLAAEVTGGSIAVFPPPHNFFWTRETSNNLGYNWYRKDGDSSYSIGIRQAEDEDDPAYAGRGPEDRRQNYALYNARPGTWQRMPMYIQVEAAASGQGAIQSALALTRDDHYKPLAGYMVMARHFHTSPVPRLLGMGGLDVVLPDFELGRSTGINIYGPVGGGGITPTGTQRIGPRQSADAVAAARAAGRTAAIASTEQPAAEGGGGFRQSPENQLKGEELYYEMARLQSRKDFIVMPDVENPAPGVPNDKAMKGHNDMMFSHPVYWTSGTRAENQPLVTDDPKYGKIYHIGSAMDLIEMAHREDAVFFTPHPNTKGSAGFPLGVKDNPYFDDEAYRGGGWRWGMGVDRSEDRLCQYRCLTLLDDMNNWMATKNAAPKYMISITETYENGPGDDFYANNPVSYIKVHGTPGQDNWRPIIDAVKAGDYFVTSGEVLITNYAIQGQGNERTISADVEWTFPLEFVEVVWGDGQKTDRQIISATDLPAYGKKHFAIPFDPTGKKWVRFAVWDSAGNGGYVQPVMLTASGAPASGAR